MRRLLATAVFVFAVLTLATRAYDPPGPPAPPAPLPEDGQIRVVAVFESGASDPVAQAAIAGEWGKIAWRDRVDALRHFDPDAPPLTDSPWRTAFDLLAPGPAVLVARGSKVRIAELPVDIGGLVDEVAQ